MSIKKKITDALSELHVLLIWNIMLHLLEWRYLIKKDCTNHLREKAYYILKQRWICMLLGNVKAVFSKSYMKHAKHIYNLALKTYSFVRYAYIYCTKKINVTRWRTWCLILLQWFLHWIRIPEKLVFFFVLGSSTKARALRLYWFSNKSSNASECWDVVAWVSWDTPLLLRSSSRWEEAQRNSQWKQA